MIHPMCVSEKEKGGEHSDTVYEGPNVSWRHKDTFEHKHAYTNIHSMTAAPNK